MMEAMTGVPEFHNGDPQDEGDDELPPSYDDSTCGDNEEDVSDNHKR